ADQLVAATAIDAANTSHVPVVVAAGEELGERQLIERRREVVDEPLVPLDLPRQAGWSDDPPEAQGGHEGLRDGPDLDDVLGRRALERSDGLAVVPELGVVVVLDDQAGGRLRPAHERVPPALA